MPVFALYALLLIAATFRVCLTALLRWSFDCDTLSLLCSVSHVLNCADPLEIRPRHVVQAPPRGAT